MPVDASIYSQVGRQNVQPLNPLDAMANAYQLQNAQIDSDNKRQAMRDDQMSRQAAMQAGGDSSKLYQLLMQGGNIGAAQKVQKATLDYDKGRSDIAKDSATTQKTLSEAEALKIGQHADILSQVQTPEQAIMWAKMGLDAGVLKPQQYEMALSNINKLQDPQSFEAWKQQAALGARKFIELNKPNYQNQNLGGTMQTLALPGLGGKPQVVSSAPITQSADSIASQETQRRGQNMVDARSREANQASREASQSVYDTERGLLINKGTGLARPAATFDGKPVGSKDKPLTDAQSKAALFGTRMQESNKVLEQLATKGTEATTMPGMNTGYGIGTVSNALASGEQQQLMQAKRDFVNAVLRRESGAVIADSEFANAEKQYFPQIGDSAQTKAQKKRNREIAIRGVQAEIPRASRGVVDEIAGNPAGIDSLLEKYK